MGLQDLLAAHPHHTDPRPLLEAPHALQGALVPLALLQMVLLLAMQLPLYLAQDLLLEALLLLVLPPAPLDLLQEAQHTHPPRMMMMIDGPSTQITNFHPLHPSRISPRNTQVEGNQVLHGQ